MSTMACTAPAWRRWIPLPAVLVTLALTAAGCASNIGESLPAAVGGLPENAPHRPSDPGTYPAVHETPPPRSQAVLTDAEQRKLEQELIAARERAKTAAPDNTAGTDKKP
ncbi:MAG: hypothetical protein ACJ8F3_00130 [Xanthobacteraceae bacterium]